ncbi:hypothetical protein IEQ34_018242 [Dendrobium chrysotoxum]|uniref:Secreted protein n=1 Tax=Dendrobium chrysotoxum TaxID=161865 RepID=A0AAV7GEV7_DENCH|nr:hypothetical protein IEQ34_018242 [Dendrobium chrysotoxum]
MSPQRACMRVVSPSISRVMPEELWRCLLRVSALLSTLSWASSASALRLATISSNCGSVALARVTESDLNRWMQNSVSRHTASQKRNSVVSTPNSASRPRIRSEEEVKLTQDSGVLGSTLKTKLLRTSTRWLHLSVVVESGDRGT